MFYPRRFYLVFDALPQKHLSAELIVDMIYNLDVYWNIKKFFQVV